MALTIILTIGGAIFVVWIYFTHTKDNSQDVLNQDAKDKDKLNALDQDISKNNANLVTEDQNRQRIQANIQKAGTDVPTKDLVDFFNDPNNNGSGNKSS